MDILYETTHHKLLQEEWVVPRNYCQACRSVRAAHILQIMEGTRLLKACHGMGTKGQRDDVGSLVVTAKNPQILSAFPENFAGHLSHWCHRVLGSNQWL